MAKMRMYKFWNITGEEKEKEAMSLKKAVMSVQSDYKDDKFISVEYVSKKGKSITDSVKIPIGRKIRQAIVIEKRRAEQKAKLEARRVMRSA
mgnify:FL=1